MNRTIFLLALSVFLAAGSSMVATDLYLPAIPILPDALNGDEVGAQATQLVAPTLEDGPLMVAVAVILSCSASLLLLPVAMRTGPDPLAAEDLAAKD